VYEIMFYTGVLCNNLFLENYAVNCSPEINGNINKTINVEATQLRHFSRRPAKRIRIFTQIDYARVSNWVYAFYPYEIRSNRVMRIERVTSDVTINETKCTFCPVRCLLNPWENIVREMHMSRFYIKQRLDGKRKSFFRSNFGNNNNYFSREMMENCIKTSNERSEYAYLPSATQPPSANRIN